jgi:hypothetical protein
MLSILDVQDQGCEVVVVRAARSLQLEALMIESEARCVDSILCEHIDHGTRLSVQFDISIYFRGCRAGIGMGAGWPGYLQFSSVLGPSVLGPVVQTRELK